MHGKGSHAWQRRVCVVKGRCVWQGGCMARVTAAAVDGAHPTGMHSCFL